MHGACTRRALAQVKHLLDAFLKDVVESGEEFARSVPTSHEKATCQDAFVFIDASKQVRPKP